MDKPASNFDFKFMSCGYKFRDFFLARLNKRASQLGLRFSTSPLANPEQKPLLAFPGAFCAWHRVLFLVLWAL